MKKTDFIFKLDSLSSEVNIALDKLFGEECKTELFNSMRYSLSAGGKRIRPVLLLSFAEAAGLKRDDAMDFACAIELIHTYSLIHDDLPCMDDDDLRRGRPSNHIVYGYAGALLAGDALLNAAFELMLNCKRVSAENAMAAAGYIGTTSGRTGMILGQSLDLANAAVSVEERIHLSALKTGAIIRGACVGGLLLAGIRDEKLLSAAEKYAENLGLAFQMRDDILDVTATEEELGKPIGSDSEEDKTTFVALLGIEETEKQINMLTEEAIAAVSDIDKDGFLTELVLSLANRKK
ncbi:MAG: polyprenyl synthetase family protein [Oscillospiraceae bacterium]|nr:polyprenyl synthetase family protein [Oscillospiraceae bacterium]